MSHRARRILTIALLGGVTATLGACATIMQGSTQQVSIGSTPSGARVLVDSMEVGRTPYVARLARKHNHVVRIEMDGYQPYELSLSRSTSGWVWGNIVFGGLIGLVVDASTGGMYKLNPEQIQATLAAEQASVTTEDDAIIVAVVLQADPEWERIGGLSAE